MSAVPTRSPSQITTAERVAQVRAQLQPIRSRRSLLESYQRESLCRLAIPALSSGSAMQVLELAYAMRWLELDADVCYPEMDEGIAIPDQLM